MINKIPSVSVIVPMYNAEKYIAELLESVFTQTLKNFELIIVDDCSTDNSVKIVEKYIPKFNGRLQILKLPNNTGGPSIPRNRGLEMSRGKYIFFMDNDDLLTQNALKEMYDSAEKFQADVIYCEKYFMSEGTGEELKKNIHVADRFIQTGNFVDKPTPILEDLKIRVIDVINYHIAAPPWLKFIKRDVLIENDIKFFNIVQEDNDWTLRLACFAKKFFRVPNICYIRRMRSDSSAVWQSKKSVNELIRIRMNRFVRGIATISKSMEKINFFQENPDYRYLVLNSWLANDLRMTLNACANLPPHIIYDILMKEFKSNFEENEVLISFLITNNLMLMKDLIITRQKLTAVTSKNTEK